MYRPQFPFPTPDNCRDEQFSYSFDSTNTPLLGQAVLANSQTRGVPLVTQSDAPFIWRGMRFEASDLDLRTQDPWGNFLEDDYTPINLYVAPSEVNPAGALVVTWEPGIYCPPGAVILLNFRNATAGDLTPGRIALLGLKRFPLNPDLGACA